MPLTCRSLPSSGTAYPARPRRPRRRSAAHHGAAPLQFAPRHGSAAHCGVTGENSPRSVRVKAIRRQEFRTLRGPNFLDLLHTTHATHSKHSIAIKQLILHRRPDPRGLKIPPQRLGRKTLRSSFGHGRSEKNEVFALCQPDASQRRKSRFCRWPTLRQRTDGLSIPCQFCQGQRFAAGRGQPNWPRSVEKNSRGACGIAMKR